MNVFLRNMLVLVNGICRLEYIEMKYTCMMKLHIHTVDMLHTYNNLIKLHQLFILSQNTMHVLSVYPFSLVSRVCQSSIVFDFTFICNI